MKVVKGVALRFVWLLAARANQILDSLCRFGALSLFEFGDPIGDRVDDIMRSLTDSLGLTSLAINALSTFDNLYFFVGHKHKREAVVFNVNEISG